MTREEYMLSAPWRHGTAGGAIVCDQPSDPAIQEDNGTLDFYGGFPVGESMPERVCEHIIAMHNASLSGKTNDERLPATADIELAIRALNCGGLADRGDYCECDASVGQSPCQYCAIHTVLWRLWKAVDPEAARDAKKGVTPE